jgi:hypothetical protein
MRNAFHYIDRLSVNTVSGDQRGINIALLDNTAFPVWSGGYSGIRLKDGNQIGLNVSLNKNTAYGDQKGVNISSLNKAEGSQIGLNIAAVTNDVGKNGDQKGCSISLFNLVKNSQVGFNLGIVNFAEYGNQTGANLGVTNVTAAGQSGFTLSGLLNLSFYQCGLAISGLLNVSEFVFGAVISPALVIAEKLKGFAAGLLTYTERFSGVIVGVVNIVKNSKESAGVQIGLLNISLDETGYRKFKPLLAVHTRTSPPPPEFLDAG